MAKTRQDLEAYLQVRQKGGKKGIIFQQLKAEQADLHDSVVSTLNPFNDELNGGIIQEAESTLEQLQRLARENATKLPETDLSFTRLFRTRDQLRNSVIINEAFQEQIDASHDLYERCSLFYVLRDLVMSLSDYGSSTHIDQILEVAAKADIDSALKRILKEVQQRLSECILITHPSSNELRLFIASDLEKCCSELDCLTKIDAPGPLFEELKSLYVAKTDSPTADKLVFNNFESYAISLRRWLNHVLLSPLLKTDLQEWRHVAIGGHETVDLGRAADTQEGVAVHLFFSDSKEINSPSKYVDLLQFFLTLLPEIILEIWRNQEDLLLRKDVLDKLTPLLLNSETGPKHVNALSDILVAWGLHNDSSLMNSMKTFLFHKYLSLLSEEDTLSKMNQELEINEAVWRCTAGQNYIGPTADAAEKVSKGLAIGAIPESIEDCVITHKAVTLCIALCGLCTAVVHSKELSNEYFSMVEMPLKVFLNTMSVPIVPLSTEVSDLYFLLHVLSRQRTMVSKGNKLFHLVLDQTKKRIEQLKVSHSTTVPTNFTTTAVLEALLSESGKVELEVALMDYLKSIQSIRNELKPVPVCVAQKIEVEIINKMTREFDDIVVNVMRVLASAAADSAQDGSSDHGSASGRGTTKPTVVPGGLMKGFIQKFSEPKIAKGVRKMISGVDNYERISEDLLVRLGDWMQHSSPISELEAILNRCSAMLHWEESTIVPPSIEILLSRLPSGKRTSVQALERKLNSHKESH